MMAMTSDATNIEWSWRLEEESFYPEEVVEFEFESDFDEDLNPLNEIEDVPLRLAPDDDEEEQSHQIMPVDLESVGYDVNEFEDLILIENVPSSDVNSLNVQNAPGNELGLDFGFGSGAGFELPVDSPPDQQVPHLNLDLNLERDIHRAHIFEDGELRQTEQLNESGRLSLSLASPPDDLIAHSVHSSSSSSH